MRVKELTRAAPYPGLSEAEAFIAGLAALYLAGPTELHARMDALLESLKRPAA